MKPQIYLDVDNCVADFSLHVTRTVKSQLDSDYAECLERSDRGGMTWEETFGMSDDAVLAMAHAEGHRWWESIPEVADRFKNAPRCLRLHDAMKGLGKVTFLTALPKTGPEFAAHGKANWLRTRMGSKFTDFIFCMRRHKALLAAPNRVLVDDSDENCEDFTNAGGCAVRYDATAFAHLPNEAAAIEYLSKAVRTALRSPGCPVTLINKDKR